MSRPKTLFSEKTDANPGFGILEKGTLLTSWVLLLLMFTDILAAQHNIRHHQPTLIERYEPSVLEFEMRQLGGNEVSETLLFTRTDGASSWSQQEGQIRGSRALFSVRVDDPDASRLEYFFEVHMRDGSSIRYPEAQSSAGYLQVDVVDSKREQYPVADFIDYTILSPLPGQPLRDDDLLIAVALFYDDEDAEGGEFLLEMNGEDVTGQAEVSPFVVKYVPEELDEGAHNLMIRIRQDGEEYEVASWSFRVVSGEPITFGEFMPQRRELPSGDLELTARNQEIAGGSEDALTGRIQVGGREGDLIYSASGYLTSRETVRLQPQNRFQIDLEYRDLLYLRGGDVNPSFSGLSIQGRRVRGIDAGLNLFGGYWETRFLMGRMNRGIDNLYGSINRDERFVGDDLVETLYLLDFEEQGRGTFQTNIIGGQMAFGKRDRFQFSLHGLKIEDDTTSVNVVNNYNDLLQHSPDLTQMLTPQDINRLEQDPGLLQLNGENPKPRGNLVVGSTLNFAFDQNRIRFQGESGMSLLNNDITGGPLTRERAEDLGLDIDSDLENLLDRLSWLIIINNQMSTLPFRYSESPMGETEVDLFFPTATLAGDSRLNLNYLGHQFQVRYRWIGPDYHSLGNRSIRRDVTGITLSDRFRLFENQLYVNMGFEHLQDNVLETRDATLRTTTWRGGISWFPVSPDLPRISFSTRYRERDNRVDRFNPSLDAELVNRSVRNFMMANGEVLTAPNPRQSETIGLDLSVTQNLNFLDIDHELVVNAGYTKTTDQVFDFGDSDNRSLSARISSRFDRFARPMRSRIGFQVNKTEAASGLAEIRVQGVDLGLETFLLDERLSLNVELALTRNRSTSLPLAVNDNQNPDTVEDNFYEPGDEADRTRRHSNAYSFRSGLEYRFDANHALLANLYLTNISDRLGNIDALPNDRILQLRYRFSF